MEIPLYDSRNGVRVVAVGDIDSMLCPLGFAGLQEIPEQPLLRRHLRHDASWVAIRGHPLAASLGHAVIEQSSATDAAGGTDQRQTGGGEVRHQLAVGRRYRRFRGGNSVRVGFQAERGAVERLLRSDLAAHEDSGAGHWPGAWTRFPDALRGYRCGPRPGVYRSGLYVPLLCRVSGLARCIPDGLGYGLQRSFRQFAANHGAATAPE